MSSIRARARASPFASSLPRSLAPSPTLSSVVTAALTSTPWMTTEDGISVAPFFLAYSAIRARTSAWSIRLMSVVPAVAHWAISWRLISVAPASAAASAAVWASERRTAALPTWNISIPTASTASSTTSRPGRICPRSPLRIEAPKASPGGPAAHGPGGPTVGRDRGSTFDLGLPWAPASRRILAAMNPRQRRGILLLTLSALGLLGVFVLVAGYVADVRAEVDPKVTVLALAKPAEKDKAITDDMVKTMELPRRWAPQTALRDRARLIGQVALADIPAGSVLQEGMIGSPPELATGEREIAILVDAETGVAGKISPGSIVDIVATFAGDEQQGVKAESNVVVPGARIIDVGQPELKGGNGVQDQAADPAQVVPVTFALKPKEALTVTYAESFAAEVRLALLRPGEESELEAEQRVYRRPSEGQ